VGFAALQKRTLLGNLAPIGLVRELRLGTGNAWQRHNNQENSCQKEPL
jgi:hypothetical protein